MVINQGDVFWIDLGEPEGSEPGYERPCVVIQNNVFNASRLHTVIVCLITSITKRGDAPGNVLLSDGGGKFTQAKCCACLTSVYD